MNCIDKKVFNSRGEAYEFICSSRKYKNSTIYECKSCGKWHLSHYKQDRYKTKKQALREESTIKWNSKLKKMNYTSLHACV